MSVLDVSKMNADQLRTLVLSMQANRPAERKISLKVSEKGAVSIYGLGRFPVTLYASQFDKLDAAWGDVQTFVKANRSLLSVKS